MAGRLAGKVCVITGAASGQGRVAAELFAGEGARLVLADLDAEGLRETAATVRERGAEAALLEGDLTQEAANEELIDLARSRFGNVDALYNAAGLVRFGRIHELSLEDWHFVIEHELTITFLGCKYALRAMLQAGAGSIINVSSVSGLYGSQNHGAHAATKAAIVGLTRQIAVEYGHAGIRCNAIAPGFLVYGAGQRRVASQTFNLTPEGIPLGRFARPEDTGLCALYLASDESSFVTGQVLIIDGGRTARG